MYSVDLGHDGGGAAHSEKYKLVNPTCPIFSRPLAYRFPVLCN